MSDTMHNRWPDMTPSERLAWRLPVGDGGSPLRTPWRVRCSMHCGCYPGPCGVTGRPYCKPPLGHPPAHVISDS